MERKETGFINAAVMTIWPNEMPVTLLYKWPISK